MESINSLIQSGKNIHSNEERDKFKTSITPFLNNKEYVLNLLENGLVSLYDVSETLKNDRDVVFTAVKKHGWELKYANPSFFNDKEIVLAALKKGKNCYEEIIGLASVKLKNDDEVALTALKNSVYCLKLLPSKYSDNKELIMKMKLYDLVGVSERLRNDKEVVLMSVSLVGENLEFASKELQDDKEVVLAAVKNSACHTAMSFASERLRGDVDVAKAAIRNFWGAVHDLSKEGKNNKEIMLYVLKKDGSYFNVASEALRKDNEVIFTALTNTADSCVIPYLDKNIQKELGTQKPIDFFANKMKEEKSKKRLKIK